MSQLDHDAERVKLAQLLGVTLTELDFLAPVAVPGLVRLRELSTEVLFGDGRTLFRQLAAASKLLPAGITASIGEKAFGPMLCARIASEMPYPRAVELAQKMSVPFLAQVTLEIDPRRVADIIRYMPLDRLRAVASELVRLRQYIVLGCFVGYMGREPLRVVLNDVQSEEALLHVGFFVEDKRQLSEIVRLLPEARLRALIGYLQTHPDLWTEALSLLFHLEDEQKRLLGDLAADLGPEVLSGLVRAVDLSGLWSDALPLFACLSPSAQFQMINLPALNEPGLLGRVLSHARDGDLWATLLPLVEYMPASQRQLVAWWLAEQGEAIRDALVAAAHAHRLWIPLLDLVGLLPVAVQRGYLDRLALDQPGLRGQWQELAALRGLPQPG